MTSDELCFAQKFFAYNCTGLKCVKITHVHNSVMLVKRCVVESALRQSSNQRHLSAFETKPDTSTRTGFLTFVPLPAGFPVPRAFTATKPLCAVSGTGARPKIMKPHHVVRPFHRALQSRAL